MTDAVFCVRMPATMLLGYTPSLSRLLVAYCEWVATCDLALFLCSSLLVVVFSPLEAPKGKFLQSAPVLFGDTSKSRIVHTHLGLSLIHI